MILGRLVFGKKLKGLSPSALGGGVDSRNEDSTP